MNEHFLLGRQRQHLSLETDIVSFWQNFKIAGYHIIQVDCKAQIKATTFMSTIRSFVKGENKKTGLKQVSCPRKEDFSEWFTYFKSNILKPLSVILF